MTNLWQANWNDVKGAVLSGVITAVIGYIATLGNVFDVDFKQVLSIAVIAALSSLLKALGTDKEGKFMGKVKIK